MAGGWWDASIEELLSAREQIDAQIVALGGALPDKDKESEEIIESDVHINSESLHFDITPFENQEFCEIVIDDIEPIALIRSKWYGRGKTGLCPADMSDFLMTNAYISPDVFISNYGKESELPIFRIVVDYSDKNWLFADRVTFKIDDEIYTFSNLGNPNYRYINSVGNVCETLIILIGNENFDFIEALYNCENEIRVRIQGSEGIEDYKIQPDALFFSDFRQMYDCMISSGGFDQAYLKRSPSSSMIVK